MRNDACWIAACVLAAATPRAARAGERITVEVYEGERPADAEAVLAPLHAELVRRGYLDGTPLAATIASKLSRDGGELSAHQVADAQHDVDDAYQRFIDGDYDRALAGARTAIAILDAAPGALARDAALRDVRYKALVIAARSSELGGKGEDAFALMAEAIRAFPDRSINGAQFDPSVTALYRRVKQDLVKQGEGTLAVNVDDPAATIFVDEQFLGSGTAKLEHALPGRYRVYVTKAQAAGRVREVALASGASATVDVPWSLDETLRVTPGGVAMVFDKSAAQADELHAAAALGRAVGATDVVVISVRPIAGHRAIAGYLVNVESQSKTFAAVQLEPVAPSAETIGKLAALLAGDKVASGPELIVRDPDEGRAVAATAGGEHHGHHGAALVVGGIGVAAALAAGGFELSSQSTYDQAKKATDPASLKTLYDSANLKYKLAQGFAVGAVACLAGAAVVWFTGGSPAEHSGVTLVPVATPDSVGVVLEGGF